MSPTFHAGGLPWNILVMYRRESGNISIYLVPRRDSSRPAGHSIRVSCALTLVHRSDASKTILREFVDFTFDNSPQQDDWGFTNFVSMSDAADPASGFIEDGCLLVKAVLTVPLNPCNLAIYTQHENLYYLGDYEHSSREGLEKTFDVQLKIDGHALPTHRTVLMQSRVLADCIVNTILGSEPSTSSAAAPMASTHNDQLPTIPIDGDLSSMLILLKLMYDSASISKLFTSEGAAAFQGALRAAHKYDCAMLLEHMGKFLCEQASRSTARLWQNVAEAAEWAIFADAMGLCALKSRCDGYLAKRPKDTARLPNLQELPQSTITHVFRASQGIK